MVHVAWTLTDNSTGSPVVYTFPINPNEFEAPGRRANMECTFWPPPPNEPRVQFLCSFRLSSDIEREWSAIDRTVCSRPPSEKVRFATQTPQR